jgi:hypothetical protein
MKVMAGLFHIYPDGQIDTKRLFIIKLIVVFAMTL